MKNEFIPYEQALALKELGFDESCIGWYNPQVNYEDEIKEVTTDRYWAFHLTGEWENFKPAPLYQQAFRWFREKHDKYGVVNIDLSNNLKDKIFVYMVEDKLGYIIDRSEEYNTYEEAEQACLDKLIEICKETWLKK